MPTTNAVLTARERAATPAPGALVDVGGDQMHVLVERRGSSAPAVVLLPGLGTASPVHDFAPLVEELAGWATVAVVEPFGYGWSDATDSSMLPHQVARDARAALRGAGVEGPYVLVAHSVGSLAAQAFVAEFPEDVAAYVGLDPTIPRTEDFVPPERRGDDDTYASPVPGGMGVAARLGGVRLAQAVAGHDPNLLSGASSGDGYDEENLRAQEMIANWSGLSPNVLAQATSLGEAVGRTADLRFPPGLPVLALVAGEDATLPAWQRAAVDDFVGPASACTTSVVLPSGHYVHHSHARDVGERTRALVDECVVSGSGSGASSR